MKKCVSVNSVVSQLGTEEMTISWISDGPTLSDLVDFIIHSKNEGNKYIHVDKDMKVKQPWGEVQLALAIRDHWTHVDVDVQV